MKIKNVNLLTLLASIANSINHPTLLLTSAKYYN